MKMIMFFYIAISLILVLLLICSCLLFIYRDISFEEIAECKVNAVECGEHSVYLPESSSFYWFTLRDPDYEGFFGSKLPTGVTIPDGIAFDVEHYTYVVTIGRKMKVLQYRYLDTKNRVFLVFPKQFVGRVVLEEKKDDNIHIYRIKKMDIDCDFHNPEYNVILE